MRILHTLTLLLVASGCGATWSVKDDDGDGFSIAQGDCNEMDAAIGPGAEEVWYNGVDENCDGNDADQDLDGYAGVDGGGDDCWDDPASVPEEFTALNGMAQPEAAGVHPDADDAWYDGVDQNCDGADDFDQDGDGHASMVYPETRTALPVDDCYDNIDEEYPDSTLDNPDVLEDFPEIADDCEEPTVELSPAAIYPGATDDFYDGTDADCSGGTDFDEDADTFPRCVDCNDADAAIFPNDTPEIWYNGTDENCDRNDGDKDGDGYVQEGYAYDIDPESSLEEGDCWDDTDTTPAEFTPLNGFPSLASDAVNPGATETWYDGIDQDCDNADDFDQDKDTFASEDYEDRSGNAAGEDCDDSLPDGGGVHPGATEGWYDGIDQDCDEKSDYDQDQDGHDSDAHGGGDCDDLDGFVNPGENEDCGTGHDDDCDGQINNGADATDCVEYWYDGDVDGYGDVTKTECHCTDDPNLASIKYTVLVSSGDEDCDDASNSDYPGATEQVNNGDDEDCDGVDSCYTDNDGDSFGSTVVKDSDDLNCTDAGEADDQTDCDDSDKDTFVGSAALELTTSCTNDDDNDGYGDITSSALYVEGTDCDDASNTDYPGASETVNNGDDEDCDGVDSCYTDSDGDSFGSTVIKDSDDLNCTDAGEADDATDCDDSDADTFVGSAALELTTACTNDDDNDGYGDITTSLLYTEGTDCDDASNTDYPGATETVNNGDDEDCDGVDSCYTDSDGDSFGSTVVKDSDDLNCTDAGEADDATDCDDSDKDTFVGSAALELTTSCTNDDDGDGYGDKTTSALYVEGTDCDDADSGDYVGATEIVNNGDDEDCDSFDSCYTDSDGDSFGSTTVKDANDLDCTDSGEADDQTDCDDSDADTFIGSAALELTTSCTNDDDNDGYGDKTASALYVEGTDCDDASSADYPGATEVVNNGDDDDCDDKEDCYTDADGDGQGISTIKESTTDLDCTDPGEADDTNDCDDTDADTFVGSAASELTTSCTNDDDNDGYGDKTTSSLYVEGTDCDDASSSDYPGATETVNNGDDEDCDTYEDCYTDADGDGQGTSTIKESTTNLTCTDSGEADDTNDCDDSDADTFVGSAALELTTSCTNDDDGDGYGDKTTSSLYVEGTDCDDAAAADNPAATEIVNNGDDEDCDTYEDCYTDADGDGQGIATIKESTTDLDCTDSGEADDTNDCDDSDADTFVGSAASELTTSCTNDDDNDGYGDETASGVYVEGTDCNDGDGTISPGDAETCTTVGVDDNCSGSSNEVNASGCTVRYEDNDSDGYGQTASEGGSSACRCTAVAPQTATSSGDCDDAEADTFPGSAASELSGQCTNDDDNDGYGDSTSSSVYVEGTDCNDGNSAISPAASDPTEGDGVDDDCDGYIDEADVGYGDLVVTEFFVGEGSDAHDFFELYNPADATTSPDYDIYLYNWTFDLCYESVTGISSPPYSNGSCDSSQEVTIDDPDLFVAPETYVVLCAAGADFAAGVCDFEWTYTGDGLEPENGYFEISMGNNDVDEIAWWTQSSGSDDWPSSSTTSVELDNTSYSATTNNDYSTTSTSSNPDIWCLSSGSDVSTSGTLNGTPGAANSTCP